ncbi:MAG: histidine phosphatase family protein [Mycobacteriaceae bacterium]
MSDTVRLTLISHGMTSAVRAARFPDDEPLEAGALAMARSASLRPPRRTLRDATARTEQTAIALGLEATVDPTLADLDAGRWRGRSLDELPPAELQAWATDLSFAAHGGESIEDLLTRVSRWLTTSATVPGSTVAFTHPAVIRAVLIIALQAAPTSFWRIDTPPLTATSLHARDGRWTLRYANSVLPG